MRLGQTWDYVLDNLTVEQIAAYRKFWKNSPPVDALAAAWMGFKPESVSTDDAVERIAGFFGGIPDGGH